MSLYKEMLKIIKAVNYPSLTYGNRVGFQIQRQPPSNTEDFLPTLGLTLPPLLAVSLVQER